MAERRLSPRERAVLAALAPMAAPVRGSTLADFVEQQDNAGWRHSRANTYGALATLQRDGLVTAYWEAEARQSLRRFEITPEGRALLVAPPASEDTHVV